MEIQPQEKPPVPAKEEKKETSELKQMEKGVREYSNSLIKSRADPDLIVNNIAAEICKIPDGPERMPAIRKLISDRGDELAMGKGVAEQFALTNVVAKEYSPLLISFARQLIEEYKCIGPSEKAMAEVAAAAYVRILQYSELFSTVKNGQSITNEKNGFYNNISKELDRAHRHFESAISMLKQMKVPTMNLKVHSKNTFIADKQQFNNLQENNESK
jgi:hypothetical protein